jgi:beta-glucosidase
MHARAAALLLAVVVAGGTATATAQSPSQPAYKDANLPVQQRVDDLLSRMTLEEKIGQMGQINLHVMMGDPTTPWDRAAFNAALMDDVLDQNRIGSILSGGGAWPPPPGNDARDWAETVNEVQRYALEEADSNRLGIPIIYGVDAVHGHNNLSDATMVPHQIGLGATFDPPLAQRLGASTARQVRATGIPWDFAPVLDTQRDHRWGRSYEPFGEDPFLNGALGSATIAGMEGRDLASQRSVAATAKHFTGYSAPDSGMDRTDATISEAELRDIHLPPFARAIDEGVATVMINSGSVNGEPVHASHRLLTDVLRGELGFKGVAISDWQDVENLITKYHVAATMPEALALAVNAGMDMSMIPLDAGGFTDGMAEAVDDDMISEARIDEAVGRILTLKFRLGLFEHPYADPAAAEAAVRDPANRTLARDAARESLVLLENHRALPLTGRGKLLVTGPAADSATNQLGGWSIGWQGAFGLPPDVTLPPVTTIREGLEQAGARVTYAQGAPDDAAADPDDPAVAAAREEAVDAARGTRAVIVAVGERPYAEGMGDDPTPELAPAQAALIDDLQATGKTVVVVVVAGRPLVMNRQLDRADAALMAFLPGSEGGSAIADVLLGDESPSGRLSVSWPRSTDQLPLAYNEPGAYAPRYAFGHGRGYTRFSVRALDGPRGVRQGQTARFDVTLANTGGRSAEHTLLAFARPVSGGRGELAGFQRTWVRRGDRDRFRVAVDTTQLEPGSYRIEVGELSRALEVR